MSLRRFLQAITCAIIVGMPSALTAGECDSSRSIPAFTATLDSGSVPTPPPEPYCGSIIVLYGTKLELFRENEMEFYNLKRLKRFTEELTSFDEDLRRSLSKGLCTAAEYEVLRVKIAREQQKTRKDGEYMDPYYKAKIAYKKYIEWQQTEAARCRLK